MESLIRILYVEDVPGDAELVLLEILKSGINLKHTIVETKKDYIDAIISFVPDLIISDYVLPQFDGMNALSLRNEIAPQTPFILVTGSVNEEVAVECMKAGADDYILKSNLTRLIPSIKAAFSKRDSILLRIDDESEFHIKDKMGKILTQFSVKKETEEPVVDGSDLKEYELFEEKLTMLDMALRSAGIGTWVFDLKRDTGFFDNKASQLLGFTNTKYKRTGTELLERIHSEDLDEVKALLTNAANKKSDFQTDFRVILPDGNIKYLTTRAKTLIDEKGRTTRLDGLLWDITDQKHLQITLQENLRKTNSIIKNLNGAVFRCRFDKEMTMEYISEGVKELSGYPSWDFLMNRVRSFASLIYTEDKERIMIAIDDAIDMKNPFTIEFRILSAQGDIKWIWMRGGGVYSVNKVIAIEGFFSDISYRKKTEEELKNSIEQLHKLTQYIEKVRENERVAISRELHDDLGQALTAVKIDLGTIKQNVTDNEVILRIIKVSSLVSETIRTVQRLTAQLRPQIIDDLGLQAAIEWYTKEFAERNKIVVLLDIDAGITITPDVSLIFFRIMQESLTNISRHANASLVDIWLTKTEDCISLRISDNGIGIKEDEINSKNSFGIISMRERAASVGGTFDIYREDNYCTVVNLTYPINQKGTYENIDL